MIAIAVLVTFAFSEDFYRLGFGRLKIVAYAARHGRRIIKDFEFDQFFETTEVLHIRF